MKNFANSIIRYRKAVIAITLVLTVFFGYFIKDIKVNSDILNSLPKDDKTAQLFNRIGKQYGGNDVAMVAIETDNIFKKETLEQIRQITDSIKTIAEIGSVTSLTDVIDIKSSEAGIEIGKLVDEYNMPETPEQFDSLKKYIFSKDMYKGTIISEDASATLIVAKILDGTDKTKVTNLIKAKIQSMKLPQTVKIYYGGLPFTINEASKMISHDLTFLGPIAFLVIALVLFLNFRSARGVVLPLLTVVITIVWTLGILSLLHYELTMITNITPVILLAIGSAWPIHVINRVNTETDADRKSALVKSLLYVALPVSLAALAAMIGFLTFIFGSYLTMIQQFGIFSAVGIFIALLLSLTFVPALIASLKPKSDTKESTENNNRKSFLDNFLKTNIKFIYKKPSYIIIPWSLVIIISIIGTTRIQHKVDMVDYFEKESDMQKTEKLLQNKFTGSMPVYVAVKGNVQSPEVLNVMKQTQQFMEKSPYIKHTQSVADLIEEMNNAMGEGKKIPKEKAKIEQLWFLLDGQDIMTQLVNDSLTEGLIQANISTTDNEVLTQFSEDLNHFTEQFKNYHVEVTGMPALYLRLDQSIVQTQRQSMLLAITFVFALAALAFKSVKKGLYSIVPMTVGIIILYGFMGWAGIPLDIATVLVASISIGVGDYALHIISGFNYYFKLEPDVNTSLRKSIQISGRAVIINVLSVSAGFFVLIFSNLVPLQRFGIIIAVAMLSSGLAAITLLPVIMKVTQKSKKIQSPDNPQLIEELEKSECLN
ncbi:MAG: MMPL family transporter [Bacteroidales bacterium]|nr:MMPL family transporter [Bacteroidales bacterium]